MNKNLESEYQNMIRAEVPDIWDKIEAKIDAQEAQKKIVPLKKKTSRWKYYVIPAAAALLCVAIAVPVLFNSKSADMATNSAPCATTSSSTGGEYTEEPAAAMDSVAADMEYFAEESCEADATWGDNSDTAGASEVNENRDKKTETNFYTSGDNSMHLAVPQVSGEADEENKDDNDEDSVTETIKGTVFTLVTGGGIPRELIEKAVQTLGLKIREYDPAENLYKIASDYELDEDTIKDIAQKLMESGFVKEVILGD